MNNGTGFNGCYATHIILRKGTKIIKLPKEINDSLAATMNCSLATMVNCVSHIPNRIKQNSHKALIQVCFYV
jgi:D-arabinose 1-dehydrogenase-like Zn-dependent alcohol dehydrogenase